MAEELGSLFSRPCQAFTRAENALDGDANDRLSALRTIVRGRLEQAVR